VLVARTGYVQAEEAVGAFWGSSLHLENIKPFSACCMLQDTTGRILSRLILALRLYRKVKDRFEHFANVSLPLVCDYSLRQDQRYPVQSLSGGVIGEIRLAVSSYGSALLFDDMRIVKVNRS
jgi:hypothetical protein